jgi:hypothetical protein
MDFVVQPPLVSILILLMARFILAMSSYLINLACEILVGLFDISNLPDTLSSLQSTLYWCCCIVHPEAVCIKKVLL